MICYLCCIDLISCSEMRNQSSYKVIHVCLHDTINCTAVWVTDTVQGGVNHRLREHTAM